MNQAVEALLLLATVLLAVPSGVFFLECLAALFSSGRTETETEPGSPLPSIALLIPAYNEEAHLLGTLESVARQIRPCDRLYVVADNCTDQTARIARDAGAEVIERLDPDRRGKGYALAHGVDHLREEPPDVVIVLDGDTRLAEGAVDTLRWRAATSKRPAQAVYLLAQAASLSQRGAISAFAFTVRNLVRPLGLRRLGMPCHLSGTGMAFHWPELSNARLATGNIVEDMQLGIDLAIAGHAPLFCPDAGVTGVLPADAAAARIQRTRWEHGHLHTLVSQMPRLLKEAVRQRRIDLLAMALDLCVPPLALLVLLQTLVLCVACGWAFLAGSWLVPMAAGGLIVSTSIAVFLAWWRFGRATVPLRGLLAIPGYALSKVSLYLRFLVSRQRAWVRTPRDCD